MTDQWSQLNEKLASYPYVDGYTISDRDFEVFKSVPVKELGGKANLARWHRHIASFKQEPSKQPTDDMELGDNLPQYLLNHLTKTGAPFNSIALAEELGLDHQKLIGAVKSLIAQDGLVTVSETSEKRTELTNEGQEMATNGSHEYNVFVAIGDEGLPQGELMKLPIGKVGMAKAIAAKWIATEKNGAEVRLVRKMAADAVVDKVREQLEQISLGQEVDAKDKTELKKRKLINEVTVKGLIVEKGPNFTTEIVKPELDLTAEMIQSGSWKEKTFKKYNFEALGVQPSSGHLHPLMKVRAEFRQIFFQMGFTEMPTNRYVESSFWNFDALFQPQQHPARDAHDTFFISDPAISTKFPTDYLERVKTVHSKGGFGSIGYNYDWKLEEAQKNVLRTHTTAVSARQLYSLAQEGFKPSKMFSIDRVFRNETLDATHLAEFHQVEGVIAEKNLSLAHLIGIFTEFFKKLGIEGLKFKPTYNPYTEPSMEIFAYHQGLKKWVEIGNSGMFRPEMLLPMGLPEDVNVAGYGLSLERPTMIRYGINNIRDLFGAKVDLEMIRKTPICRLSKKD
ncbi:unnamed protein product, partial [Mesorhabditis spiculigera]